MCSQTARPLTVCIKMPCSALLTGLILQLNLSPHLCCSLIARAAYVAIALARTLDVDVASLRRVAAAAAAAAPLAAEAVPFHPAAASHYSPPAAAAAGAAGEDASLTVSSEDLDGSDTERTFIEETEAAVAPYMARLSPSGPAPLQPIPEAAEAEAAAAEAGVAAAVPSAAPAAVGAGAHPLGPAVDAAASAAAADPAAAADEPKTALTRQRRQQQQQQPAHAQPELGKPGQQIAQLEQLVEEPPDQQTAASLEKPPAIQTAAAATAADPPKAEPTPLTPLQQPLKPAPDEGPSLIPWAKAAEAAGERQFYASGAMSLTTLRFVSPRLEAEFGAAYAAFLLRWVSDLTHTPSKPAIVYMCCRF